MTLILKTINALRDPYLRHIALPLLGGILILTAWCFAFFGLATVALLSLFTSHPFRSLLAGAALAVMLLKEAR